MILYGYWRSSAAYRVRIALNLKGLSYQQRSINLAQGEQHDAAYRELNPQGLVPALEDGEVLLTQSSAILEYLEESYPREPLLPRDPLARARAREISALIGCDIHPLNNLRVLQYLEGSLGISPEGKLDWYFHWLEKGLEVIEHKVMPGGPYCLGPQLSLADLYLIPQLYNARRFGFDLERYPYLTRIESSCNRLDAFANAIPEQQQDAQLVS
ncbi:maleylacetoacetate isomerase [Dongshaea marina]|uniref:maleylacetoacetate isomerase n=1 Tax=Dongshaea marina TaxID=2047966 RepID=UPI000D3EDE06|nr:maleylacetoacetate isomerase [Dongshaea marina]